MSGFAAILQTNGAAIDPRLLHHTINVAPFDSGRAQLWTDEGVGLCAAPLDSPHVQPHSFARNTRLSIVMDGRLDDRETLVRRLDAELGRPFTAASDVELVLGAYERWGADCVSHLLGDFSFCLWDAGIRQLFCARDHLGVKPLYYARVGTALIVSNVLHSIRRHPRVSARLDDYAVGDLLLVSACMYPSRTSFADIARVPPAHTLRCSMSSPAEHVERYWSLTPRDELRLRDPREYIDAYVGVLETVVRDRLRDAPVGILLSGGLDSSSVAAAAVGVQGTDPSGRLRAYTFVYDTVAEDEERKYSSIVARHLGIEIEHHPLDRYEWFERWNADLLPPEPSTEPMTAMMADLLERVAGHSAVALTGDGGDPAFLPSPLIRLLRNRAPHLVISAFARSLWQTRSIPPIGLRAMVRHWFGPPAAATIPVWLSEAFVRRCDLRARREVLTGRGTDEGPRGLAARASADLWWASTFETYDPGATRRPVELRYPLLDVRFIAFALSLPTYPWCVNKTIVRAAMCGRLPDEICARPKSPLAVDPLRTHGRLTKADIAAAIEGAPELQAYIDPRRFTATVRDDRVLTDEEPGTWAAAALATWLGCAARTNVRTLPWGGRAASSAACRAL
jgi:asparagine synthase (glutamine-hydrolysing)